MSRSEIPDVCKVTNAEYDVDLIKDIANIEQLVQPFDSWNEPIITGLLAQDINECWAVMNPDSLDDDLGNINGESSRNINSEVNGESRCEIVAYCIFSKVFEVVDILRIGTHPKFQRQGLAEWLLKLIIKHLPNKQLKKILLEVREDNKAAIHLYQKMGFKTIHTRKGYYANLNDDNSATRCDALVMQYLIDEYASKNTHF